MIIGQAIYDQEVFTWRHRLAPLSNRSLVDLTYFSDILLHHFFLASSLQTSNLRSQSLLHIVRQRTPTS